MAKVLKQAGLLALERTLSSMFPQLMERLERLESELSEQRRRTEIEFHDVRQLIKLESERTRDAVNEVAQRVARVEGAVQAVIDLNRNRDELLERVVRLEMSIPQPRKRRAS